MNREQYLDERLVQVLEGIAKAYEAMDEIILEDARAQFLYRPHLSQALRDLLFAAETLLMAISDIELNGRKRFKT